MSNAMCPWCEAAIELAADDTVEQQCPECMTTWCYEESEFELPLAA